MKFLRSEGADPVEIHHRLFCTSQKDADALSSFVYIVEFINFVSTLVNSIVTFPKQSMHVRHFNRDEKATTHPSSVENRR
jgi:hypothetical protein